MQRTMGRPGPGRSGSLLLASMILSTALIGLAFMPGEDTVAPESPTPGTADLRVAVDPETGELGLAPASDNLASDKLASEDQTSVDPAKALSSSLSRSTDGLVVQRMPNGARRVHLQGRFQSASVVRIDENGELDFNCVESSEAAASHRAGCTHGNKLEVR